MNDAGKHRAEQLAQRKYSLMEYRNRLVRMQNMDAVCHCSAEIDMGTLLYFSVNGMYLGQGYFVLLLFSELSAATEEQQAGRDVFSRMFAYGIVEEVAREVFTGHYSFYCSELDGRFVMILNFPFGLLPDRSIVDYLDHNCREVSDRCRRLYDMNVVTYVGEPLDDIHFLTAVYDKLQDTATLHRYLDRRLPDPVYHVPLPPAVSPAAPPPGPDALAERIMDCLPDADALYRTADQALETLAERQPASVDGLKLRSGELFEALCRLARERGIKLRYDELREEQFRILFDSVRWEEPVRWLRGFLDAILQGEAETRQRAAQLQFQRALAYIEANLSDPGLTIETCAAAAGCSVSALSKAFRRQKNTSAAKYIRERRLSMARDLLRSGAAVGEAGARCGFGSAETFHRAFKEKYGVTPGQLRLAERAGTEKE